MAGRLLLVVVSLLLAGACGSDRTTPSADGSTTSTAPPSTTSATPVAEPDPVGGLVAEIGTNRLYETRGALGLSLRNVGGTPVEVVSVQLASPAYEELAASPATVLLQPGGRRFVVPLPRGPARCDADPPSTFRTIVATADGRVLDVPAVEEYSGAVARAHARECAAAAVRDAVTISFGETWQRDGRAAIGELTVSRRPDTPEVDVAVDDATGNVIFTLRIAGPGSPILGLDPGETQARVPVTISADRCDPHAVAEFKRPMVFLAWIALDDGDAVPVEFEATGDVRRLLEQIIAGCQGT